MESDRYGAGRRPYRIYRQFFVKEHDHEQGKHPFSLRFCRQLPPPGGAEAGPGGLSGRKNRTDELKAAEDAAIRALVAKQKAAGYHVITDDEFRRATWHLDFMWGFHGVGHHPTEKGLPFQGEAAMLDDTYLTGEVGVDSHPFVEHFRFVKALEIGPLQGAMSSIALCVCGIITSILAMFFTA